MTAVGASLLSVRCAQVRVDGGRRWDWVACRATGASWKEGRLTAVRCALTRDRGTCTGLEPVIYVGLRRPGAP